MTSYISKDCLILLVITMKGTSYKAMIWFQSQMCLADIADDIQNQKAVRLAQEADSMGKRTIGVLTRVDTLRGREVDLWMKVLKNETQPLLHGYFVSSVGVTGGI